ncbi:putative gamma-glutamylcyclotransferase CG2811 [Diadema antillarum]|uniref:putative gamma-glutamylcyclotransferase CG2811 n=1 Tax=Diadema antillarum TaxID=105358 RepID=UPI003A8599AF
MTLLYTCGVVLRRHISTAAPAMAHRVFVYGTLKTGQPNYRLMAGLRLIGIGRTRTKMPLVVATEFGIPMLLDHEGGHNVVGEVYEVDDENLAKVDALESFPGGYYDRMKIGVQLEGEYAAPTGQGGLTDCWAYVVTNFKPSMLDLERFESYDSEGAHGKKYVKPSDRGEGAVSKVKAAVLKP